MSSKALRQFPSDSRILESFSNTQSSLSDCLESCSLIQRKTKSIVFEKAVIPHPLARFVETGFGYSYPLVFNILSKIAGVSLK